MQGNLGVERMCLLAEVSRASFYRSLKERAPVEEDVEVRSAVQQVALEHRRRYGSRRVTAALRRRGMVVNRNGSRASCRRTICSRCSRGALSRPRIRSTRWRSI
jgi:hypothetical protein